jgi:hypothetical protein
MSGAFSRPRAAECTILFSQTMTSDDSNIRPSLSGMAQARSGASRTVLGGISLLLLVSFALHTGVGGSDRSWSLKHSEGGADSGRMVVQTSRHSERRFVRRQSDRPVIAAILVSARIPVRGGQVAMRPTTATPVRAMLPVWWTDLPPPTPTAPAMPRATISAWC